MPRDPYIREKYTREVKTARAVARDYFERFPKDRNKSPAAALNPGSLAWS